MTNYLFKKSQRLIEQIKECYFIFKARKYIDDDINRIFDGKTVAIVGPASSSMTNKNGEFIDKFDIIIRINKGYQLLDIDDNQEYIGSRTDVLFSRLDDRECLDPQNFDKQIFEDQGLKYLIGFMRTPTLGHYHRTISFIEKYGKLFNQELKVLSIKKYAKVFASLCNAKPSVGYIALNSVVESKATLIYITGITFYLTGYQKGYRDYISKKEMLQKFKRRSDGHDPNTELLKFKEVYQSDKKRFILDQFLNNYFAMNHK